MMMKSRSRFCALLVTLIVTQENSTLQSTVPATASDRR